MQKKSAKEVLKRLETFQPDQLDFIYSKKYAASLSADKWMRFFKKIVVLDNSVDELLVSSRKKRIWFMVASIICLFTSMLIIPAFILPITLVLMIIFWVRESKFKKIDIDNKCKNFIVPFIAMLKQDCAPNQKIKLDINFLRLDTPEFLISDEKLPGKGYPKVRVLFYKKKWLSGSYQMIDKTDISFDFERVFRLKKVTKKNYRGKIKYKQKQQHKLLVNMLIKIDKNQYSLKPGFKMQKQIVFNKFGNSKGLISCSDSGDNYVFKLKASFIDRRAQDKEFFLPAEDASGLIANVYNLVTPK